MHVLTSSCSDERIQPVVHPLGRVEDTSVPGLALCREHRLEHRTKHIALRYFLARELQQRGQLRLAYVASEANTANIFTKALAPGFPTCTHLIASSFIPVSSQHARSSMVVLDSYRGHLTGAVKEKFRELNCVPAIIPSGYTAEVQPLNVSINKSFKASVRQQYQKWFKEEGQEQLTRAEATPRGGREVDLTGLESSARRPHQARLPHLWHQQRA
ncbi:unnamed protein product [Closterium sp. NIES-54]